MSFEIHGDIADLGELVTGLKLVEKGMETAVARAINKTLKGARTDAVKMIRKDYNLKASLIREKLIIRRAHVVDLWGAIQGWGSPGIPLLEFTRGRVRVPSTRRLKGGGYSPKVGISVLVRKHGGNKKVKGAFVAQMKSGHIGVFRRNGGNATTARISGAKQTLSPNRQIEELYGPSPIKILRSDRYDEVMEDMIQIRWDKNILHEAEFILKKAGLMGW